MGNHGKEDHLDLRLSIGYSSPPPSPSQSSQPPSSQPFLTHVIPTPPPHPPSHLHAPPQEPAVSSSFRASRPRKSQSQPVLKQGKTETIPPPYPWATNRRATVCSLDHLLSNGIKVIRGELQCRRCEKQYVMEYDLEEKFMELARYIRENNSSMHQRAPNLWINPTLPNCKYCDQSNFVRPVVGKKRSINWLFLLLGQMLGSCKLSELKYFCKHTKNHRTGAKDRLLYLTYLGLCKQLDPTAGPFDVSLS